MEMTDRLFFILAMLITASCAYHRNDAATPFEFRNLCTYAFLYVLCRILFSPGKTRKVCEQIIVLSISCLCLYESYLCVEQITGHRFSNNQRFICTGTFSNPGPLAGLLAVGSTLALSWIILYGKENSGNSFIASLTSRTALLSAFTGTVLIPATGSRSALCSLAAGLLAVLAKKRPAGLERLITGHRYLFFTASVLLLMLSTVCMYNVKKESAEGRLFMNRITIMAIAESPLTGTGPGSFTHSYGNAQYRYFTGGNYTEKERMTADCPEFAFNTFLCTGLEYGVPSMILLISAIICSIVNSTRNASPFGESLLALAVFSLFSYPHEIAVFRLLMPVFAASGASSARMPRNTATAAAILSSTLFLWCIPGMAVTAETEKKWKALQTLYRQQDYSSVVKSYPELLPEMKHNYRFLFQFGHSLREERQYARSDTILKMGESLSGDPMFWNLIGRNAQDMGNSAEAERCYSKAFSMIPNRLYPLYLLAVLYHETGNAEKFSDMIEQIDGFKPKVESEVTRTLRKELYALDSIPVSDCRHFKHFPNKPEMAYDCNGNNL